CLIFVRGVNTGPGISSFFVEPIVYLRLLNTVLYSSPRQGVDLVTCIQKLVDYIFLTML
ncbi:hypothetical protein BKA69DRAFT_1073716, partial [Paraphysoderma sedebokerense]